MWWRLHRPGLVGRTDGVATSVSTGSGAGGSPAVSTEVGPTRSIPNRAQRAQGSADDRAAVPTKPRSRTWQRTLVRAAKAADLGVLLLVSTVAIAIGVHDASRAWELDVAIQLGAAGGIIALVAMSAVRCWDAGVIGQGAEEFGRIVKAFVVASLVLATVGLFFKVNEVRPWVFGVLPAIGLGVLAGRVLIRRVLHAARRADACMSTVLVVGSHQAVADLASRTRRVPHHGWTVVGACTSMGSSDGGDDDIDGTPVVGDLDDVAHHVKELGVDVVAIAPTPGWTPKRLHRLAWQLEGTGVELVVDPGLMEIGGPRLHMAPVDGLPLLRLTEPRFSGVTRLVKNGFDRVAASLLVLVLAPVFLVLAVLIRGDGGAVFYRQERVGLGGRTFRMVKFRSMVVDADRAVDALVATNEGSGPLFKMKADPRVTRIGRTLRRLSLDELPQLFNVIAGSMSLVGPRPPLAREVAAYADDARRKLLVRPGMTGLWQVSGRSDLSWEESVRLDLRYVENWSPALDVSILWKTVGAVFKGRGAY